MMLDFAAHELAAAVDDVLDDVERPHAHPDDVREVLDTPATLPNAKRVQLDLFAVACGRCGCSSTSPCTPKCSPASSGLCKACWYRGAR